MTLQLRASIVPCALAVIFCLQAALCSPSSGPTGLVERDGEWIELTPEDNQPVRLDWEEVSKSTGKEKILYERALRKLDAKLTPAQNTIFQEAYEEQRKSRFDAAIA